MRHISQVHIVILSFLALTAKIQGQDSIRTPPPSVLSEAWVTISSEGPIGDAFCAASTSWFDGAYYMHVKSADYGTWKLMLMPPIGRKDWQIKVLRSAVDRRSGNAIANQARRDRSAWSVDFAKAMRKIPQPFIGATSFKVRAVKEDKLVTYYLEKSSPPAWMIFTVEKAGSIRIIDSGF